MSTTLTKEYQRLIERFALRPIKNAEQKTKAVQVMRELAMKGSTLRTEDESDYLVVLGRLIADYERTIPAVQKFVAETGAITPAESLAYLMEANDLTQTQLAEAIRPTRVTYRRFLPVSEG